MKKKIFTMAWSALLTFLMLFPATLYAQYEGEIGTEGGWQTDTNGSITGTPGTQFIWVNEANFPDDNFRYYVLTLYKVNSYDASDGILTSEELNKVSSIECNNKNIARLDGIAFFASLTNLKCSGNLLKVLDVSQNTKLRYLNCNSNQLTSLDVSKNLVLNTLSCISNQLTSLDVSKNSSLKYLGCASNQLTSLDVSNNLTLTSLTCHSNQLKSLDVSKNNLLEDLYCYRNQLTSLDVRNNSKLINLSCFANLLTALNLPNNVALDILFCQTNQLTELDLSFFSSMTSGTISYQIITPVFNTPDNRSKVGIQCHTNTGKSGHYGSFEMVDFEGNNHVIIADGTQDVEFLKSPEIIYNYQTDYSGSLDKLKHMSVTFKTSAYAMYVNPRSKMKDAPAGNKNFFGTLYVDYPVVVPAEAKCYIGTGIDPSTEQLELAQIASAGQVIPALTPFVVKGMDGSGFYVFREATEEDGTPVTVSGNILAGNLEDTSVTPMSVLTLGIENGTGELGYWNYRGSTLKAHRAYVPASALSNLSSGSRGLSLAFDDATTTGVHISSVLSSGTQTAESWYTLDGCKLIGKPLQRGVYIHNGKKEIVK